MNGWLYFGGMMVALGATFDAFKTTVSFSGGGPLTRRLASGVWSLALAVHRRGGSRKVLHSAGSITLLLTVMLWLAMIFAGYTMMFSSDPDAVVNATSRIPATVLERIYYTGFTLFTLGVGDYIPQGDGWRTLTVLATLHGMFLVTLSITYLLPVVSAVVEKHALAGLIYGLGRSPLEILTRAGTAGGFKTLDTPLLEIAKSMEVHTQRHLAYPILHYFQSSGRRTGFAPNLAALHEALVVMSSLKDTSPTPSALAALSAVRGFLDLMSEHEKHSVRPEAPDVPLDRYRLAGLDLGEGRFTSSERMIMGQMLVNCGWSWDDVDDTGRSAEPSGQCAPNLLQSAVDTSPEDP